MKKLLLPLLACFLASGVMAKEKMLPLPESAVATLQGKTLAITRHPVPSFTAMTAGKATFGLFGAGAMISEGNKMIRENEVADPAELLEKQLAPAFAKHYGMQIVPASMAVIDEEKPKKIAATQTGMDYIFDIRSGGWMYAYYPTDWDSYWILYSVQVQLIDAKDGNLVANMACNANTQKHAKSPGRKDMLANKAQLIKDVTMAHGWTCMKLLAKDQFLLPESEIAATPAEYVDPLTLFADQKAGAGKVENTVVPTADAVPAKTQ